VSLGELRPGSRVVEVGPGIGYARIRRRIEAPPERRVRKMYLAILNLARRL